MKPGLRFALIAAGLFVATTALVIADIRTSQPTGLTVHEWGTFTSVAGEDGTAMDWDVLGGKDDLPCFVNDRGYRGWKWRLTGTVRMETPVLYFYSSQALNAHVRVSFPHGLITEWYPNAEYQVEQRNRAGAERRLEPNLNGIDTSLARLTGSIEWKDIRVEPETTPRLPFENRPSRYYAARATDAAPITVDDEHEKFLFYRGVGRLAVPLSASLSANGSVVVANQGTDAVPQVILFENRGGRLGYRNAGAISGSTTIYRPSLDGGFPQLRNDLGSALVAQGLFHKEAEAMIETWQDSWFEEGSRLIYIVPSRTVEAVLPLQIDPVPSQVTRVFVGRIELITPESKRAVAEALAGNDTAAIGRYGRFLDPILKLISLENSADASKIDRLRASLDYSVAPGCH
jgi:hypothetical protein